MLYYKILILKERLFVRIGLLYILSEISCLPPTNYLNIRIGQRITNLRYTNDTTLFTESLDAKAAKRTEDSK